MQFSNNGSMSTSIINAVTVEQATRVQLAVGNPGHLASVGEWAV